MANSGLRHDLRGSGFKAEYAEGGDKSGEGGQVQEGVVVRVLRASEHPA